MDEQKTVFFNAAYEKYYRRIVSFIVVKCADMRDVEDIVQEVFAEFFHIVDKKGSTYIKNVQALLFRIARIKLYRYYSLMQRLRRHIPLTREDEDGETAENYEFEYIDVEEQYINDYTAGEVWNYIKKHPDEIQKIFVLHYHFDKPLREVALLLGITESNVKHKLYKTITSLRKLYNKEEGL